MYKIKITYDTGDSFHTEHDVEGLVEASWNNLDIAKENLQRIKEHWQYYKTLHKHSFYGDDVERKKLEQEEKTKCWYVKKYDFVLKLKTDEGNEFQYNTFWCGYFERLNHAEIIEEQAKDYGLSFSDCDVPYLGEKE